MIYVGQHEVTIEDYTKLSKDDFMSRYKGLSDNDYLSIEGKLEKTALILNTQYDKPIEYSTEDPLESLMAKIKGGVTLRQINDTQKVYSEISAKRMDQSKILGTFGKPDGPKFFIFKENEHTYANKWICKIGTGTGSSVMFSNKKGLNHKSSGVCDTAKEAVISVIDMINLYMGYKQGTGIKSTLSQGNEEIITAKPTKG